MARENSETVRTVYVLDTGIALFELQGNTLEQAKKHAQSILNNHNFHHYGEGKIYKRTQRVIHEYSRCLKNMESET